MYIRSIFVAVALLVTVLQPASGQTLLIDSLRQALLRNNLSPQEHIVTMALLARAHSRTDAAEGLGIAQDAVQRAWTLKDPATTSFAYSILSMLRYYNGDGESAAYAILDSAFYYARQSRQKRPLGIAWFRKAWLQNIEGKFQEAVGGFMEALRNLDGTNSFNYESSIYYALSTAHGNWKDLPQQGKYGRLCLETARKSGDLDNIASAHQVLASYYLNMFQKDERKQPLLDTALLHFRKGVEVYLKHGDKMVFQKMLPIVALHVAGLYQQYPIGHHAQDSIDRYVGIAMKSSSATGQSAVTSMCYGMLSEYELGRGNFKKAEQILLSGLTAIQEADSVKRSRLKSKVLEKLVEVAEKQGDYQKAFRYYHDYHRLYEALFDAERLGIVKKLETQYQSEKDQAALASLQQANALNERLNRVYIALSVTIALVLLLLLWSLRSRLKVTLQQKKLLEVEKEDAALTAQLKQQENKQLALEKLEAELKARLKEEEALRLQAEQKLMHELQGRLQKDLLAGSLQIEQKDELLQTVQKKIEASTKDQTIVRQINSIIDQNKKTDESFAANRAEFDSVRPEFFEQLRQKSNDTLSRLDLKHCAYISIGLTNKEIAQRLAVAPKSILMSRYRIKIKLGLTKEEDLDEFIGKLG
jgi:DNA-binding CsgD family transcriptional regulator